MSRRSSSSDDDEKGFHGKGYDESSEIPWFDAYDGSPDVVLDPSWADRDHGPPKPHYKHSAGLIGRSRKLPPEFRHMDRELVELNLTKPTPVTELLPFFSVDLKPR